MTRKEYNGWTNYETWVVKLWIDNDEGSYNFWREEAERFANDDDIRALAEALESAHQEALPQVEGFAADLLNAGMSEVNWDEIASSMIEDWKADHAEEEEAA